MFFKNLSKISLFISLSLVAMEKTRDLQQALLDAITKEDAQLVFAILVRGANPNYVPVGQPKASPLRHAIGKNPEIVQILLQHGANPALDEELLCDTLFRVVEKNEKLYIIRQNKAKMADILIDDPRTNLNCKDCLGQTPLMWAVEQQNLVLIEKLLNTKKVTINAENNSGITALGLARGKTKHKIAIQELLQKYGAKLGSKQRKPAGMPMPKQAAAPRRQPGTEYQFGFAAKPAAAPYGMPAGQPFSMPQQTPKTTLEEDLFNAVRDNNSTDLHALLWFADVNIIDPKLDYTPLQSAAYLNRASIIPLLLQAATIEPNKVNNRGLTALMIAVGKGSSDAVAALLEDPRVNVNYAPRGITALGLALKKNTQPWISIAQMLKDRGAKMPEEPRARMPMPQIKRPDFAPAVYQALGVGINASPHEILGVGRKAPSEDIRAAYKHLSTQWHPDKNPGNPTAGDVFKLIRWAYEALGGQ